MFSKGQDELMESHRVHVVRFQGSELSRHFLVFDADVSLAQRIEILSSAVLQSQSSTSSVLWDSVELRTISDPHHPACGGLALYATRPIPGRQILGPYTGVIQFCNEAVSSRTYAMGFGSANDDFVVDAEFAGGLARFANDPRNTGKQPNVVAESRISLLGESYTALVSKRPIQAGEEILMDYGKAFSLEPRLWVKDGEVVTRHRTVADLPCPNVAVLMRECSICSHLSPASLHTCPNCRGPLATQHARVIFVEKEASFQEEADLKRRWPQGVAFLSWQVWDPLVPLCSIVTHSEFKQQESLSLYEFGGVFQVVTTKRLAPGDVVCFVGGVVTFQNPAEDPNGLRRLEFVTVSRLLGLLRPLYLVVTNEAQHVSVEQDESTANCKIIVMQDPLGCPCVALQATKHVEPFSELSTVVP